MGTRRSSKEAKIEDNLLAGNEATPIMNLQLNGLGKSKSEAVRRWSKIKEVLRPVEVIKPLQLELSLNRQDSMKRSVAEEWSINTVDDEQLLSFWDDLTMPIPPAYQPISGPYACYPGNEFKSNNSADSGPSSQDKFEPPAPITNFDEGFEAECKHVSLMISRVPRNFILEQKEALKATIQEEQKDLNARILKRETELVLNEQLAGKRILESEALARKRMNIEKVRCSIAIEEKEKKMSRDFVRARENLEQGIKKQAATIRERYGDISTAGSSLTRLYSVQSTYAPQPVELRMHMLRAVRSKLSKGKYVLMLTQYESLGGKPIGWSKVSEYGESQLDVLRIGAAVDSIAVFV
jgi:hypothetical protein